jgi:hypothetical protein
MEKNNIITCINKALCILIQNVSLSSFFNLFGSTVFNRQMSKGMTDGGAERRGEER